MNSKQRVASIRRWIRDPFALSVAILSVAANIVGIATDVPFIGAVAILIGSVSIGFGAVSWRRWYRAKRVRLAVSKGLDHFDFVSEFVDSVGGFSGVEDLVFDHCHYIKSIEIVDYIEGADSHTIETKHGTNVSDRTTDGINIKLSGGSSLHHSEVRFEFTMSTHNLTTSQPILIKEEERSKWYRLPFPRALHTNEDFTLVYEAWWPSSMRYGTDVSIIGHPMDYEHEIGEIMYTMYFDKDVHMMTAYAVDISNAEFSPDSAQPERKESDDPSYQAKFTWKKSRPQINTMYFLVFTRDQNKEGPAD